MKEFTLEEKQRFGERIKYVRKQIAHMTQQDFAYSLYVSRGYLNQLENAKRNTAPSQAFIEHLCKQYGISTDWLNNGIKPVLQKEAEENQKIRNEQTEHSFIPKGKPYPPEYSFHQLCSSLELDLQELFHPQQLSPKEYGKLLDTYVTLTRPFYKFMNQIKQESLKNRTPNEELYNLYYKELAFTIQHLLAEQELQTAFSKIKVQD